VEFIYVFSHSVMMKRSNNSLTNNEILAFWNLLQQVAYPKDYKRIATNSSNYYCAHSIDDKIF